MRPGARTPEELETLFEDAFVPRDRAAMAALFDEGAVLAVDAGAAEARGDDIAGSVAALWDSDFTFLADPRRVLQTRDTALVLAARGVSVVLRGSDGGWRYAISLLDIDDTTERNNR
jgi:hypothetical protein